MQPVPDTWMSAGGGAAAAASSSAQRRAVATALTPAYIRACMPPLRDEEDELFAKHRNACAQQMRDAARALKWETIYSMPDTDESDVHVLDAVFDRIVGWLCSEHFVVQPHSSSIRCIVISWDPAANPENISAQERADPNSNAMKRLRAVQRRMRTAATDLPTVHTAFPLQQQQQKQQQQQQQQQPTAQFAMSGAGRSAFHQVPPAAAVYEFDQASRLRSEQIAERAAMVAGNGIKTPELEKQPKTPPPPSPPPLRTLTPHLSPPLATVPTPVASPVAASPATSPATSAVASPSGSRVVSPGLSTASDTDAITVHVVPRDHGVSLEDGVDGADGADGAATTSSSSENHDSDDDNNASSDAGSE